MTDFGGPSRPDPSDLEARLRDAFDEARRVQLPAGFFDGWPDALPARPRMWLRSPVPAAAAVAVAAGLVLAVVLTSRPPTVVPGSAPSPSAAWSSSAVPSLPPGVVGWIDATPAPSPSPSQRSTAGLPGCSSDALQLRFAGWEGVSGGTVSGGVVISQPDAAASTCVMSGIPTVSILDAQGRALAIDVLAIPRPTSLAVVIEPGLSLPPEHVALLVGQAGFMFFWSNWCGPNPGSSGTLVIDLTGAGTRRLAIDLETPTCVAGGDRSTMTVDPLQAAQSPEPSPPPWTDLAADIQVPSVATAGQTLRYYLTLRNMGDQPVPLEPCPVYVEHLWSGNTIVTEPRYVLNCALVAAIAPGSSTTFEMVLEIPGDAPPGSATLLWATDGLGPGSQKLPITIAPPGSAIGSVAPATLPPSRDELDLAEATRVATSFETARAGGDRQTAWQLLSSFSQTRIGSLDAFVRAETMFNDQGGATFAVGEPGKSGDLLRPEFLGNALFFDLKGHAQLERAWFVSVTHPDVRGAAAGSENLIVAPLIDGTWRVWMR
jgi:hypothetical protein